MHTARDTGRARADNPAIPSRRGMLAAGAAALVAGAAIATAAHGAPVALPGGPGDDAELIRLCDRIVVIWKELAAICTADQWAPDKGPYKPRHDAIYAERSAIYDRLWDMEAPVTTAGARALARAALTEVDRNPDGAQICHDTCQWMLLTLAESQAGAAFEGELAQIVQREMQAEGIGPTQEDQALFDETVARMMAASDAKQEAEMAEIRRRTNVETMTRAELEASIPGTLEMRATVDRLYRRTIERLEGDAV